MNRKRRATHYLSSMLAMPALVCLSLVLFTACSDNDEPVEEVTYSWGFADLSASSPDFMDDINKIESTFKAALGASGTATSVTKKGTSETCDKEVSEACQQVLESLTGEVWLGHYIFTVTNVTTGIVVFSHSFDANNENSEYYIGSDLKMGDYFYSDGTWSDGGLRGIFDDGTIEEVERMPKSGKTVVGIVFYAGHHPADKSDYSDTGIGQAKCHGYVVALTDVNNGRGDLLCWADGPGRVYHLKVGVSIDIADWQGYSNSQKFHEFVKEEANKSNGWEIKHFPAVFACETYGNRTVDRKGNKTNAYEWQHPLSAPDKTSGWFLPSCGQLQYLYQNSSLLSDRMAYVRKSTPADCNYKNHIEWFTTDYYWSSNEDFEDSFFRKYAWDVDFSDGRAEQLNKNYPSNVRAVLAF